MPRVTIGMPTFNRAKSLKRAIKQVRDQTYQDYEFIIYNDGSTDNTVEVVKSFHDDRIKFINEKNKGLPHPLNKILELSRGEYIVILHDHDKFSPQLIEKSVIALDEHPEAGFVLQGCAWINSDETTGYQEFILDLPYINNGKKFGEKLLIKSKNFSSPFHASCMVRKSAYEKVGKYYDESFGWYTDVDLWLRLLKEFHFIYLAEVLFIFTGREQNHILNKKIWQVSKWQQDIFLANTYRFFERETEKQIALKRLYKKVKKNNFINLIATFVSNDQELIDIGFMHLEKSKNYLALEYLVKGLKLFPFLKKLMTKLLYFINRIRKKFLVKMH